MTNAQVEEYFAGVSKTRIREIFVAAGFTIAEGEPDLKPCVFDAARRLLEEVQPKHIGYASCHNTPGAFQYQLNFSMAAVYRDTALSILPVYVLAGDTAEANRFFPEVK